MSGEADTKNSKKGLGFQHTPSDSKAHLVSRFRHKDRFRFRDLLGVSRVLS
jgi:hypothetical protein